MAKVFQSESFVVRILQAGLFLDKVYTPFLCLFGAIGNSISLALFCLDPTYRRQSSSYYLSALAISDTGFLINLFAVWLEHVHGGVITSWVMCPLVMYLGQVTCFVSIYLMVGFTIERYVAVHYPLARSHICTRSKAKKGIIGVTSAALLLFSYAWFIAQVVAIQTNANTEISPKNQINLTENTHMQNVFAQLDKKTAMLENFSQAENINSASKELDNFKAFNLQSNWPQPQHTKVAILKTEDVDKAQIYLPQNHVKSNGTFPKFKLLGKSTQDFGEWDSENPLLAVSLNRDANFTNSIGKPNLNPTEIYVTTEQIELEMQFTEPSTSNSYRCSVPLEYHRISEIANYLDTVVTLIIPFVLITYCNLRIAMALWKFKHERQFLVALQGLEPSPCTKMVKLKVCKNGKGLLKPSYKNIDQLPVSTNENARRTTSQIIFSAHHKKTRGYQCSSEVRVTKLLLLVSTSFLVFNLPLHVLRCAQFVQTLTGTQEGKDILVALQPWANLLFNTNFAVNFLFYCVSGKSFRQSIQKIGIGMAGKSSQHRITQSSAPIQRKVEARNCKGDPGSSFEVPMMGLNYKPRFVPQSSAV